MSGIFSSSVIDVLQRHRPPPGLSVWLRPRDWLNVLHNVFIVGVAPAE